MPEGTSNVEIAHHVQERRGEHARLKRHEFLVEIFEALLLALVAIATAWSGYQAALWDGHQSNLYGQSSRIRITATARGTRAGQEQLYDATTFNFWLQARVAGDAQLATEYMKRFRPEYRPAYRAWLRTDPFHNPNAPPGPILMPQYHNALAARSARLDKQASAVFDRGTKARETGDKYIRTTVLLATILFLVAVSQRFEIFRVRLVLLAIALVLLVGALTSIATYPRL